MFRFPTPDKKLFLADPDRTVLAFWKVSIDRLRRGVVHTAEWRGVLINENNPFFIFITKSVMT